MHAILLSIVEGFENFLMSSPRLLRFVITKTPAWLLVSLGRAKALLYVRATSNRVPAYRQFLQQEGVQLNTINSIRTFSRLPITTKENYILAYPLEERLLDGLYPLAGNIDESAGSSGKATMWIRSFKEEMKLNKLITFALDFTFNSFKKRNIVVLNCWSNGPWATGIKFAFIAQHSTLVKAIGTNKENVIDTIKTLGKKNEYVICGYPPFTKEIIDTGEAQGLNWDDYRINIVTGGEGFSEGWRDFMRQKIKGSQGEVYSAYGASDIDIGVAFETDFSIALRKKLTEDPELRLATLHDYRVPLFIGQYNPLIYYIERTSEGELLFTLVNQHTVSPKIRYNLKDSGSLLTYTEAIALLSETERKRHVSNSMHLPLIIIYGRSDGTISLDGANIYPADVQHGLFNSPISSGVNSFQLETSYDTNNAMQFTVHIELIPGLLANQISKQQLTETADCLVKHLIDVNRDYRESYENNQDSLAPKLILHEHDSPLFSANHNKIKHAYFRKATKS